MNGEYALETATPVRHVATALDKAFPEALSVAELAATYTHPVPADLTRIKLHENRATDADATEFLISFALDALKHRGKTGRSKVQITSNGDGRHQLAVPFDELEYEGGKLVRLVKTDARDEERALRAAYNDMAEDRSLYVSIAGARGGLKERQYKLHPLARLIPQISEKEFFELAADVKRHGVKMPLVTYGGDVLDGRHRLAIAAALKVPVRVDEFTGTQDEARDHVVSLNVHRRHLTVAQRGLIVRELYLPQAKNEAEQRQAIQGGDKLGHSTQRQMALGQMSESAKAAEIAAERASGLATVRTIERMAPVDDAPQTKEKIRRGEIKTAAQARREAEKEQGLSPTKLGVIQPRSAWRRLGCALGDVNDAVKTISEADATTTVENRDFTGRIAAIRGRLDDIAKLISSDMR